MAAVNLAYVFIKIIFIFEFWKLSFLWFISCNFSCLFSIHVQNHLWSFWFHGSKQLWFFFVLYQTNQVKWCFNFSNPGTNSSARYSSCPSRDFGWQQRYARFCGRVVVLSILGLLLYPFLWAWTIIGTMWFSSAKSCVLLLLTRLWCIMQIIICSYLKRDRNGDSSSGYFLATVDFFALLACQ
jgi:hypothetical protein